MSSSRPHSRTTSPHLVANVPSELMGALGLDDDQIMLGDGGEHHHHHHHHHESASTAIGQDEHQEEEPPMSPTSAERKKEAERSFYCTLAALTMCVCNESLGMNMLLPFVPSYVAHLMGLPVSEAGWYSGMVVSSFHLGQMITGRVWGRLGDLAGRRPVIFSGLVASFTTQLLFGCVPATPGSYVGLVIICIIRFLQGVSSGVMSTTKTCIAESSSAENEGIAFSCISFSFGIGTVLGQSSSAYLYVESSSTDTNSSLALLSNYSSVSRTPLEAFLHEYPAFPPCAVAAAYGLISLIVLIAVLPETNERVAAQILAQPGCVGTLSRFCSGIKTVIAETCCASSHPAAAAAADGPGRRLPQSEEDAAAEGNLDDTVEMRSQTKSDSVVTQQQQHDDEPAEIEIRGMWDIFSVPELANLRAVFICYMSLAAAEISYGETVPLLAVLPAALGGFGVSVALLGAMNAANGVAQISSNLFFPLMWNGGIGLMLFTHSNVIIGTLTALTPLLSLLLSFGAVGGVPPAAVFDSAFVTLSVIRMIFISFGFTTVSIGLKMHSPKNSLGSCMGLTQSGASFVRLLTPLLAAPLFAWSVNISSNLLPPPWNVSITFFLVAGISLFSVVYSWRMFGWPGVFGPCVYAAKGCRGSDSESESDGEEVEGQQQQQREDNCLVAADETPARVREEILMPWEEEENEQTDN